MDTTEDDVMLTKNANNITTSQDHENKNTINQCLSLHEMDVKKNKDDDNSFTKIQDTDEQIIECNLDDDKKQNECSNHKNKSDKNKSNGISQEDCGESTSEPVEKRYKKSPNNSSNNSILDDDCTDVVNGKQNGKNSQEGSYHNQNDSIKEVDTNCSSKNEEQINPNSSPDLNVNKNEPCCSNQKIYFKQKSKLKKRHYRKSSENSEELDEESKKKSKETMSCEDSSNDSNISYSSPTDSNTRRHSSDQDSQTSMPEEKDDSSEWITDSDEEGRKTPQVLKNPIPKPTMFIVPELMRREFGCNRFLDRKFYGSLHAVQRLELMYKMEEHDGCVNAINFNEDGSLLASGSDDLKVVVWDWAVGRKRTVLDTGHSLNIFETKWLTSHNKNLIATCARDGHVRLIDINTNQHRRLASHREEARRLAIVPDNPYKLISVGDDGKVLTIDIREKRRGLLLKVEENGHHISLYTVHVNPRNSNEFCTGGRSQTVTIFDRRRTILPMKKLTPQALTKNTTVYVTCAVYNYNGTEIVASYNNDDIYLFDTENPQVSVDCAHKYEGHRNNNTVKSVNFFGPKSEFIVSGSDCGNIFFWDKNTEAIIQWMPGDEKGVVNRLEPHPYVPILATSGLDSDVKIWVPSCEHEPHLTGISECVKTNFKYRRENLSHIPDPFDSPSFPLFARFISQYRILANSMNRISRSLAVDRRLSQDGFYEVESDSSSSSRSSNSNSQSDSDGSESPQCRTS